MTRLLNAEQVALLLHVPKQRIYELTREKRIPFVKIGDRQYRYSEAALQAWLNDGGNQRRESDGGESSGQ